MDAFRDPTYRLFAIFTVGMLTLIATPETWHSWLVLVFGFLLVSYGYWATSHRE